jgi:hypothetical protein
MHTPKYGDIVATIKGDTANFSADTELLAVITPNGTVRIANPITGPRWNGTLADALELYNLWQWDDANWLPIKDIDDVLPPLELPGICLTEPEQFSMRFTKREMFQGALIEYLTSYDVKHSAPLVTFTLDTNPEQVVEMVLRDTTEVDDEVTIFVGRPKEDSMYGPKIYVLSKSIVSAEVAE